MNKVLSEDVLDTLTFTKWFDSGTEKIRMIKKLNEFYNHLPKCHRETNKGNYTILQNVISNSAFDLDREVAYNNR